MRFLQLLSIVSTAFALKPMHIEFLSSTLYQCNDLSFNVSTPDPGKSIDIVYTPKSSGSTLAAYGPGVAEAQNEKRCYTVIQFRMDYNDTYEAEQLRIGGVDVEIEKADLGKGVIGGVKSFITWNGYDVQDFTNAQFDGPLVKNSIIGHQVNVSKPLDAHCVYEPPVINTLRVWNYYSVRKGNDTTEEGSGTLSGGTKVSLRFVWKTKCSYPFDDGDKKLEAIKNY